LEEIGAVNEREGALVAVLKMAQEKLGLYFGNVCDSTGAGEYVGGVPYPALMARINAALKEACDDSPRVVNETFKKVDLMLDGSSEAFLQLNEKGQVLAVLTPEYEKELIAKIVEAVRREPLV
jgi:hypothetical protein